MEIDIHALLSGSPSLVFFLVLGFGYFIGNLRIGKLVLGPTAGVLLAGLSFGHFGYGEKEAVSSIGFMLFMYSVGLSAGPRFFSVFFQDGFKYVSLALVVSATGFATAKALSAMLGFESGISAGLLAGALTSSPTLAAAQDAVKTVFPNAVDVIGNQVGVGYAITYVFGMIGLMVFIKFVPGLFRVDLQASASEMAKRCNMDDDEEEEINDCRPDFTIRVFKVEHSEIIGKTLAELGLPRKNGSVVQEIKRDGEVFQPDAKTELLEGDRIAVSGPAKELEYMNKMIGPGVFDPEMLAQNLDTVQVVVTNAEVAGRSLSDLHALAKYGSFITRIVRASIKLPMNAEFVLERGDVLTVTGNRKRLKELVKLLGHVERDIVETDLLTLAFGIAAGLLIGLVTVKIGTLHIGLGSAGGLLVSGIAIGFLRFLHPTFGRIPPQARWIISELGLQFFMAGIGLSAGRTIVAALMDVGLPLFFSGVVVTLAPMLVGLIYGRFILKMNFALLLGAITGSMTSTPSLSVVKAAANSNVPALGYAGSYAFANVFLALAGAMLIYF